MYMHAQEVLFSNKIYKKSLQRFLKMVVKIVFITKCDEKKLFETHYSSEKNCLQLPKMVTPR